MLRDGLAALVRVVEELGAGSVGGRPAKRRRGEGGKGVGGSGAIQAPYAEDPEDEGEVDEDP